MSAELIAVGSELLRGGRADTNGDWLVERLLRLGIEVVVRACVDDDAERIASNVRAALGRSEIVVLTGGLGPTEDDRTREALALALDLPLERDREQVRLLERRFAAYGRAFRPVQLKQADRPRGAEWIANPLGSAPGLSIRWKGRLVAAFPGVPAEMKRMFEESLAPLLAGRGVAVAVRTLKVAGRMESSVDEQVRDLYDEPGLDATILAGREGIELRLVLRGATPEEARDRLAVIESRFVERLGEDLYGRDEEDLPEVVGRLLERAGKTVATAESCTAGLLAGRITSTAGSSGWFRGGLVVYDDEVKLSLAGVRAEILARHGAVSEAVARELAEAAAARCGASYGLGVTGIAGPTGGTAEKPVGLVHLGLAGARGTEHWRTRMVGDRDLVRRRTVTFALDRLRRRLLAEAETR
jgi:nicotinamide-nucleotide amidase